MNVLLEASALPNLHPAIVHFPIALLPIALLVDVAGRIGRKIRPLASKLEWTRPAATCLYILALLGAFAARYFGERAEDSLVGLAAELQPRIATHDDWSFYTTIALSMVAVLSVAGHWLRRPPRLGHGLGWAALGIAVIACGLLVRTADLGGALVYRHGIAVAAGVPSEATEPAAAHEHADDHEAADPEHAEDDGHPDDRPESRLVRGDDGSITWRPNPGDGAILSSLLRFGATSGLSVDSVQTSESHEGLRLQFDTADPLYVLLPDSIGDAEVRAKLTIESLEGSVGVVHHADSARSAGSFRITSEGVVELIDLREGTAKSLDRADSTAPDVGGSLEIAVSVTGSHLKGMIGAKTVAHGHAPSLRGAHAGLVFQGRGRIVLNEFRVTMLDQPPR